jgi:glutathione S-transferase
LFWELKRDEDKQSQPWVRRQNRKIDGALKTMSELVKSRTGGSDYLLANVLTIADIAVVCAVGHTDFAGIRPGWQDQFPELAAYWKKLDERKSFAETRPVMFDLKPNVV